MKKTIRKKNKKKHFIEMKISHWEEFEMEIKQNWMML